MGWWLQPRTGGPLTFAELFPRFSPNDLQRTVEDVSKQLTQPGLVIIEAPMGEGKTEAAMYLADHWAESIDPF